MSSDFHTLRTRNYPAINNTHGESVTYTTPAGSGSSQTCEIVRHGLVEEGEDGRGTYEVYAATIKYFKGQSSYVAPSIDGSFTFDSETWEIESMERDDPVLVEMRLVRMVRKEVHPGNYRA